LMQGLISAPGCNRCSNMAELYWSTPPPFWWTSFS
jgi:hypothetical protein